MEIKILVCLMYSVCLCQMNTIYKLIIKQSEVETMASIQKSEVMKT